MKSNDLHIIQHMRKDARANLTTISRKTGIPVSTIFDRLKVHRENFVIKFTALVDFAKLGYPVKANIFLKIEPQSRDAVKNFLLAHDRVNNLFRINNGYDYAAECVFTSIKEVEEFVENIEYKHKVLDKQVFHIIDDLAREKVMALEYSDQ